MAKRRNLNKEEDVKVEVDVVNTILPTRHRLKCKNQKQKEFSKLITEKEIVFATGPAGVGKSYVAIARAIELLQNKSNQYKTITLINPAVEADEKLGFIPGSVREKLDPFVASSIDIIDKIIGRGNRIKLEEAKIIEVGGLGFVRGKSIDNTILVMEEAQNMSPRQMKTLLTRIGFNSKFIISGDLDQSDRYKDYKQSGLFDGVNKHKNINEIGFVNFDESEIVRNPLISKILKNYKTIQNTKYFISGKSDHLLDAIDSVYDKQPKPNKKKKPKWRRKISFWWNNNFKW